MTTENKAARILQKVAEARMQKVATARIMQKIAEARYAMRSEASFNPAYEAGFRKAAESYGVDPEELLKKAQWNAIGNALNVGKWFPKYIDLLKGGAGQRKAIAQAFKSKYGVGMGKTLRNMEKTLKDGVRITDAQPDRFDALLKSYLAHKAPLEQLNRNVLLARLGTGGALAAGGLYGINKLTAGDNRPGEMYLD